MENVRVRIAPSPSGFLHIGTAKIALLNWLHARQTGGTFVLRLEDTDAERTEEQYVEAMCEGFKWLGVDWDEGPPFGSEPERGPYAPYRQSQRAHLHRAAAAQLLASGHAYKCFCTKEELDAERERAQAEAQVAQTRVTIPPLQIELDTQLNRLDVLMGAQPGTYAAEIRASQPALTVPSVALS